MIEAQGRQHIGKNAHPKASPLADRCPRDSGSEAVAPVKFPVLCWPGLTTTTWFATWRFIEGTIEISNQQHGRRRVHRLSDTPWEGAAARERCPWPRVPRRGRIGLGAPCGGEKPQDSAAQRA